MGCTCSKGVEDAYKIKKRKGSQKFLKKLVSFSQRKIAVEKVGNEDEKSAEPNAAQGEVEDKKLIVFESRVMPQLQRWASMDPILQGEKLPVCGALSVRGGIDGAHIVAGWPFWLTAVAGEAINGWIPRKLESFEKLDKIGQGTYSNVYRAHDLETGKIVALKKVRFCVTDPESVRFMAREILILRRLDHPNVMKLEGVITSRVSSDLYLVFEYMEHDLAGLAASPTIKFTEPQIKCYMQQLLCGLEHCHSRGVLHRDIKGSNLLIDNNGNLKIGDFGLANLSCANQKQPLTSRVVTLWYRPPELLLGSTDYGIGVDLWSSGCILAELFAGKSLLPGRTEVEQLHKIFKLCGSPSEEYWKKSKLPLATFFKPQQPYQRRVSEALKDLLPPSALALVESLLAFEPECRESTTSALQSEFFQAEPLPCDPSSFPKYPPSKQFDAKLRNEEARKRGSLQTGHSMQIGASENLLAIVDEGPNLNSVNAVDFEIHRSQKPRERVAGASHSSQLDFSTESRANCYKLEKCLNTTYKEVNHAESFHHFLGRPDSSDKNNEQVHGKQITMGIAALSMERMVKEHEKQIQIPIRRARIDKNKTRKCFSEDGQTNPLLECISEE